MEFEERDKEERKEVQRVRTEKLGIVQYCENLRRRNWKLENEVRS